MASEVASSVKLEEDAKTPLRPISGYGGDRNTPISVEDYKFGFRGKAAVIDVDDYVDQQDDVVVLEDRNWKAQVRSSSKERSSGKRRASTLLSGVRIVEIGESSSQAIEIGDSAVASEFSETPAPTAFCAICMEPKLVSDSFGMSGCTHLFCADCVGQYVAVKLGENVTKIRCPNPDCKDGFLEPERCHSILPPEVFERWCSSLCESLLIGSTGFYCPFKDCSAPLMNDDSEVIRESECPHCWRLFCAQCKVPWHAGVTCEAFQKLGEGERGREDILLLNMVKNKKWQRCPQCKMYVERVDGCMFMKCRCGYTFCYGCGTKMTVNHYCTKCKR